MSFSPASREITQGASKGEARIILLKNEQDLTATKQESNNCQAYWNLEPDEVHVASQPSSTGPSVWRRGSLNEAISKENTAENTAGHIGEDISGGLVTALSSLEQADQTESSYKNVDHEPSLNFGGLHEDHAFSQPLEACSDFLVNRNSYSSSDIAVSLTENGMGVNNNASESESKPLELHTGRGANQTFKIFEENFVDVAKQQLPEQVSSAAVVVSMDLDGWQRFDSEGNEGNIASGCDRDIDMKLPNKGELWEQLLEEGSEDGETHCRTSILQVEGETGIDKALSGGTHFWLASPGNPFIEGLDRTSNFSEADHCTESEFVAKFQPPGKFEANMRLPYKESPFCTDDTNENSLQDKLDEQKGSQSNGGNKPAKSRFPSFSDLRRPSCGSKDPYFASFLDQAPAFQANHAHGVESGEEKWEATFDTTGPVAQEGPRSLSLPREAGTTRGPTQKQGFPFFSGEAPARSQSKTSSPKQSSIVKKVVSKVRTKSAGEVHDAVCNGKSSSTVNKEPKRRIWRCCICGSSKI